METMSGILFFIASVCVAGFAHIEPSGEINLIASVCRFWVKKSRREVLLLDS